MKQQIDTKLSKALEKYGFELNYPEYTSEEELIIDILNSEEPRFYRLIKIIILFNDIDKSKILKSLNNEQKKTFQKYSKLPFDNNQIILFRKYKQNINTGFYEEKLKDEITSIAKKTEDLEERILIINAIEKMTLNFNQNKERTIDIRSKYNLQQSINTIFSLGKQNIMQKIENKEELTPTEYSYFSKAIRPLLESILNENLKKYAQMILSTKRIKRK
jgi:hypothetical protein